MVTRFRKNRKKRGHISAGHGHVGKHKPILGGVSSHEIEEVCLVAVSHLPTTLCDGVHVQEVAYRHKDSVLKVLKDDEKEHEEDDE
ncbi:hypothetical protein Tco_1378964 [Tanacetum coccineum]